MLLPHTPQFPLLYAIRITIYATALLPPSAQWSLASSKSSPARPRSCFAISPDHASPPTSLISTCCTGLPGRRFIAPTKLSLPVCGGLLARRRVGEKEIRCAIWRFRSECKVGGRRHRRGEPSVNSVRWATGPAIAHSRRIQVGKQSPRHVHFCLSVGLLSGVEWMLLINKVRDGLDGL